MNSVMDDNKILRLTNGARIAMPEQVTLLFETGDMAVASPATVSRKLNDRIRSFDQQSNKHIRFLDK